MVHDTSQQKTRFTSGQWEVEDYPTPGATFIYAAEDKQQICLVGDAGQCRAPEEALANARLIAHAPALFDFLEGQLINGDGCYCEDGYVCQGHQLFKAITEAQS